MTRDSLLGPWFDVCAPVSGCFRGYSGIALTPDDMRNTFKAPPAPRYPRIDPTKPMTDKAAALYRLHGLLKAGNP